MKTKLAVEFEWKLVGSVHVAASRLVFPPVSEQPGAYRFRLPDRVYVGETDRLTRRFQHYRTPGPTQTTNLRLNALLQHLLASGAQVGVDVVTTAFVEHDGERTELDLSHKPARLLVENTALTIERMAGRHVENL